MRRWDPELHGEGKCLRCGRPIVEHDPFYFSGPHGEEVHAECEAKYVSRNPTRAGDIFLVLGKKANDTPAMDLLKISNLDLAIQQARSWLVANGTPGQGVVKVHDVYIQSVVYEVRLDADHQLIVAE